MLALLRLTCKMIFDVHHRGILIVLIFVFCYCFFVKITIKICSVLFSSGNSPLYGESRNINQEANSK